jgi:Tfp pilus assembly protein PilO
MTGTAMKRPDRRRQVWVYIVALLFCIDFAFDGYLPSHRRLQSLRQTSAQQQQTIMMAAAQSKELAGLKARLRSAEQIIEHYDAHIPWEASLGVFLQEIAQIMTRHHLADQVVVPGQERESDGVRCISVHVNCKGGLKDVFNFFHDFQKMDRLVRIEKVALKNDSDLTGRITMDADAMIVYRPQAERHAAELADGTSKVENNGA